MTDALNAGRAEGGIGRQAAREVLEEVEQAFNQFESGDVDDALGDLQDARDEVAKHAEKEEISPAHAAVLNRIIDDLERSMTAPAS
jgi:hypothetical protein